MTASPSESRLRAYATRPGVLAHIALAIAVYPALLLTARGDVASDSKQFLFLDPGRFLARVTSLWDPHVGAGTVTHQQIGYLFPTGPYFWLTDQLGLPTWLAQRLWLGTILFAAGAGVLCLARTLGWRGAGPLVAALAYAWAPYPLQYASHLSVLLLPFAGLPWLIAFTLRSVRAGGWRWPACFALVVATIGTINATALACVLVGPLVALVVEACRGAEARRRVVSTAVRIGALSSLVSLWWVLALGIEAKHGLAVLDFTETLETATVASSAPEVLRGLGYWFFYGRDSLDPYLRASHAMTRSLPLVATAATALLAMLSALVVRWRVRALVLALLLVGLVVAVGAFPYDSPSPFGRFFRALVEAEGPFQALRSITRVAPLVGLAIALLIGAGITGIGGWSTTFSRVALVGVVIVLAVAQAPLWQGDYISDTRTRPEDVPAYWIDATRALDRRGDATRVLELPGIDFGAYTWGYTLDSITTGLMDRPTLAREVVPYGTEGTVDLLVALDGRVQNGVLDAEALPALARLLGVGDILVRGDVDAERYGNASPSEVWELLVTAADDLGSPTTFGPELTGDAPALAVLSVEDEEPIVRAIGTDVPVIVAGSGDGLVDAAEAGLLPTDRIIVYSATLADRPEVERRLLADGAELVITDSNRRRAGRFKTLRGNAGYTERAGEQPLEDDPEDARLDLFPGTGDEARTVTIVDGPTARASAYANTLSLDASERPQLSVDGDPDTAWRVGARSGPVIGEHLEIRLPRATTTDHLAVLQTTGTRTIERLRLTFDGDETVDVTLDPSSRDQAQTIDIGDRRFRTVGLEILSTRDAADAEELSSVGIAEVEIPGVDPADEVLRLPRDLLDRLGDESDEHALTVLLSRPRNADAGEDHIARVFELPTERSFTLSGTARRTDPGGASSVDECRTDLLTIDGEAVPVTIVDEKARDGSLSVSVCEDAELTLDPGHHVLRTAPGRDTGVDLDQLVLRSDVPDFVAASSAPQVRVVQNDSTERRIEVQGANDPFWLVLGESYDEGWSARIADGELDDPVLAEGYANAWYVRPHRASFEIELTWTGQRWVSPTLIVSALGIVLCLVLALRRRDAAVAVADDAPELDAVLAVQPAPRLSASGVATAVGATFLIGTVFAGLIPGVVLALGMVAALRLTRGLQIVGAAALVAVGGSFLAIVARQTQRGYPVDFGWSLIFDEVHAVALTGVLLVAVHAVARWLRARADGGDTQ